MKLSIIFVRRNFYRVKKGQSLDEIARAFGVPPRVLAAYNGLSCEASAGSILKIPASRYNLYRVRGGESKSLLCGSTENFYARNATNCFYPDQLVCL